MHILPITRIPLIALAAAAVLASPAGLAGAEKPGATAKLRDGQRDFDFTFGRWKIQLRRLKKPLTGSNEWVEYSGTTHSRPLWDGKANIEEFLVDSPEGGRIEGLTLRLYSPASRQWSLYWANKKAGQIGGVPTVGAR